MLRLFRLLFDENPSLITAVGKSLNTPPSPIDRKTFNRGMINLIFQRYGNQIMVAPS